MWLLLRLLLRLLLPLRVVEGTALAVARNAAMEGMVDVDQEAVAVGTTVVIAANTEATEERNTIMQSGTKKVIRIMKYRTAVSSNQRHSIAT